ncbi:MAG: antibiotic biosynthesis monooxygenase family protein [Planctomycetota bacterium]
MSKKHLYGLLLLSAGLTVALIVSGCRVGYPFQGPGYDPAKGVTEPTAGKEVFIAITQGEITSGSASAFFDRLEAVMASMPEQEGLIGYALRKELVGRRVWTMSAWVDQEALESFLASPEHRAAVRDGGIPRGSVIYAYANWPKDEMPITWKQAEQLLGEQNPSRTKP